MTTVTPKCPVCQNRYSTSVKPMTMHPCNHGCCEDCIIAYRENSQEDIKCPICREVVIEEKPNYDLIEMLPDPRNQGYWGKKLMECYDRTGVTVYIHEEVELFAKPILSRVANHSQLQKMKKPWTQEDRKLLSTIKDNFRECIIFSECNFDQSTKWLQVMDFPKPIENYLMSQIMTLFEMKDFLAPMEAEWLLELIPSTV
jgi:hypothetical protein